MQTHEFHPMSWKEDLQRAKTCLDILEFCGEADDVAAQLHSIMEPIYLDLADPVPLLPQLPMTTPTNEVPDASHLFRIPHPSVSGQTSLAVTLYEMLSRPFRETEAPEYGDVSSVGALWHY
jgi:hypothetical protein